MNEWVLVPTSLPEERPVTADGVLAFLEADLRTRGWRIATVNRSEPGAEEISTSMVEPVTKTVRLAAWAERGPLDRARLLAHEATHTRQFEAPWLTRLGRGLLYLFSATYRIAIEVEAKAHAALTDYLMIRTSNTGTRLELVIARATTKSALANLTTRKFPYLTTIDYETLAGRIRRRITELVLEESYP